MVPGLRGERGKGKRQHERLLARRKKAEKSPPRLRPKRRVGTYPEEGKHRGRRLIAFCMPNRWSDPTESAKPRVSKINDHSGSAADGGGIKHRQGQGKGKREADGERLLHQVILLAVSSDEHGGGEWIERKDR